MASTTLVPVSEYLRTSYEPDADYVDGQIEVRFVGERDHSFLQRKLLLLLSAQATEPFFICTGELRLQVSPTRFRIPDLIVLAAEAPVEQVVQTPPLLCIEILSPEDTMPRTLVRAREFIHVGVPEVWIFDPSRRMAHLYNGTSLMTQVDGLLTVPGTPITVSIAEVFSAIDPQPAKS